MNANLLITLLREVYPAVADHEAAKALLGHCRAFIEDGAVIGPTTQAQARTLFNLTFASVPGQAAENTELRAKSLSSLRRAILTQANPWAAAKPWGWEAAAKLVHYADPKSLDALLNLGHTPSGDELTRHLMNRVWEQEGEVNPYVESGALTLLGMACADPANEASVTSLVKIISVLVEHGVDPNAIVAESGKPATSLAGWSPTLLASLFQNGLRANHTTQERSAIAWALGEATNPYWVTHALKAAQGLSATSAQFVADLQEAWPDLMQPWGVILAEDRIRRAERNLELMQEVAVQAGLSLTARREQTPNIFGHWARHLVMKAHTDSSNYCLLHCGMLDDYAANFGIRHAWTGFVEPGIPDGAWALVVFANQTVDKKHPVISRAVANRFMGGRESTFWDGFERMLEQVGHHSSIAHALPGLQTTMPKANWHRCRDIVFNKAVQAFLAQEDSPAHPGTRLLPLAARLLELEDRHDGTLGSDPTTAVCLHIMQGWRSEKGVRLGEEMLTKSPARFDLGRIQAVLEISQAQKMIEPQRAARLQGLLVNLQTSPTELARIQPRL